MLYKKMIRDIRKNLSQFISIFLMILIGVMAYSGIKAYMDGMQKTSDTFYNENNLQDLNVTGANLTIEDLKQIRQIEHVKGAERKLSITATTDKKKKLLLNMLETNNISKFYIIKGEKFDYNKSGVWLDNFYANENNIKIGDTIKVNFEDLKLNEKVLGFINVPDHLYDVQDSSELYPDRKKFGFAYISSNEIKEDYIKDKLKRELQIKDEEFDVSFVDFDYKEYITFNTIMVDVDKKSNVNYVKEEIENTIKKKLAIIKIEDTVSYKTYQGEIDEGKAFIGVFSGLFIFIAALSVITTMTRVVKKERVQIGTLKALGFSNKRILLHYIEYGIFVAILGAIIGLLLGYFFIGKVFINLEMSMFEIPNGSPVLYISSYIMAMLVVLLISFITYLTCRSILKENAAETLRNKIPTVKQNSLDITNKGFIKRLSFSSKWNIRDIIRNKMRTIMALTGMIGCTMLIVCALGMFDSMNYFIDLQFEKLYNFDYKLNLKERITSNELKILTDKYGNHTSKTLGIEIKDNNKKEANNIFVTDAKDSIRFVDNKNNSIKGPNDNGVFITYKLSKKYNLKIGDKIKWHIYGDKKYHTSKIIGFNKDPQNQNITMNRKYLEKIGIKYTPDTLYTNENLNDVKNIKNVSNIQDIGNLKDGMREMLSMMQTMLILLISIAVLLGGIIIYNSGILSLSEKLYQFSTLKVLGFDNKKIKKIFIKQNIMITVVAILIGMILGFYLTDFLFKIALDDQYDFGAHIYFKTYIYAAIGSFLTTYIVSLYLSRKIKTIDMVSSLKANE